MKPFYQKPKVFIGSTVEALHYADALTNLFSNEDIEVVPWHLHFENGFESAITQLDDLKEYDYGIIIFTPDDKLKYRNRNYNAPRDNTIFELGLLIGVLGKKRVFPIIPKSSELKLPSDLIGTSPLKFEYTYDKNITLKDRKLALQDAYYNIKDKIYTYGPKNSVLIHDKLLLNKEGDSLLFKIAFTGPNSMLNANFSLNLIKIYKSDEGGYGREWKNLKLTSNQVSEQVPEIAISWSTSHKFIIEHELIRNGSSVITKEKSPLLKFFDNEEKLSVEDLKSLTNYKIRLDINGYDSSNMEPVYSKRLFNLSDIMQGAFRRFYEMDEKGNLIHDTIDWNKFWEIK